MIPVKQRRSLGKARRKKEGLINKTSGGHTQRFPQLTERSLKGTLHTWLQEVSPQFTKSRTGPTTELQGMAKKTTEAPSLLSYFSTALTQRPRLCLPHQVWNTQQARSGSALFVYCKSHFAPYMKDLKTRKMMQAQIVLVMTAQVNHFFLQTGLLRKKHQNSVIYYPK